MTKLYNWGCQMNKINNTIVYEINTWIKNFIKRSCSIYNFRYNSCASFTNQDDLVKAIQVN